MQNAVIYIVYMVYSVETMLINILRAIKFANINNVAFQSLSVTVIEFFKVKIQFGCKLESYLTLVGH